MPFMQVGKDLQDHLSNHQPSTTIITLKPRPQVPQVCNFLTYVWFSSPGRGRTWGRDKDCKDKDSASSTFGPAGSATSHGGERASPGSLS